MAATAGAIIADMDDRREDYDDACMRAVKEPTAATVPDCPETPSAISDAAAAPQSPPVTVAPASAASVSFDSPVLAPVSAPYIAPLPPSASATVAIRQDSAATILAIMLICGVLARLLELEMRNALDPAGIYTEQSLTYVIRRTKRRSMERAARSNGSDVVTRGGNCDRKLASQVLRPYFSSLNDTQAALSAERTEKRRISQQLTAANAENQLFRFIVFVYNAAEIQAGRVANAMQTTAQDLEIERHRTAGLLQEVAAADNENRQLKQTIKVNEATNAETVAALKAKVTAAEAEIEKRDAGLQARDEELNSVHATLNATRDDRDNIASELRTTKVQLNDVSRLQTASQTANNDAQATIRELREQNEKMTSERDAAIANELKANKAQLDDASRTQTPSQTALDEAQATIEDLRQQNGNLILERDTAVANSDAASKGKAQAEQVLAVKQGELDALIQQNQNLTTEKDNAITSAQSAWIAQGQATQQIDGKQAEVNTLSEHLKSVTIEKNNAIARAEAALKSHPQAEAKFAALEAHNRGLTNEVDHFRTLTGQWYDEAQRLQNALSMTEQTCQFYQTQCQTLPSDLEDAYLKGRLTQFLDGDGVEPSTKPNPKPDPEPIPQSNAEPNAQTNPIDIAQEIPAANAEASTNKRVRIINGSGIRPEEDEAANDELPHKKGGKGKEAEHAAPPTIEGSGPRSRPIRKPISQRPEDVDFNDLSSYIVPDDPEDDLIKFIKEEQPQCPTCFQLLPLPPGAQ